MDRLRLEIDSALRSGVAQWRESLGWDNDPLQDAIDSQHASDNTPETLEGRDR